MPRGFAHLALQLAFPTVAFSDDQADEITSVDRSGDLGTDGVYIFHEEHQVMLLQAKSSPNIDKSAAHDFITAFRDVPGKLVSKKWQDEAHAEMKDLANEFVDAIRNGYDLVLTFATRSNLSDTVRSTFPEQEVIQLLGQKVATQMQLMDAEDLDDRFQKLLLGMYGKPTNVRFAMRANQMHMPDGEEQVAYITLAADEFIKECKPYSIELFRFNPRLYLGTNKVNERIEETLDDNVLRKYFHLLNNGITAVCASMDVVEAGEDELVINIEDFQIVNGCQTSMTLFTRSAKINADPGCLVDIKVISSRNLRNLISETTNTQTAIIADDAFANEPEQKRIQELLDKNDPSYFYSPKRGLWEILPNTSAGKRKYLDRDSELGRHRRLTSRELASAMLAILGEPEYAKDKPRVVFEKQDGKTSQLYKRIFEAKFTAGQWLLPFELFRHANALAKREKRKNPDGERARIALYGRYRLVQISYAYLMDREGLTRNDVMNAKASQGYLSTIDGFAPQLMEVGLDALVDAYKDTQARESSGFREFFREKRHQPLVYERFDTAIQNQGRSAERTGQTLDQFLGFGQKK